MSKQTLSKIAAWRKVVTTTVPIVGMIDLATGRIVFADKYRAEFTPDNGNERDERDGK